MKILVADDDSLLLKLMKGLLSKWGYEVVCVDNGIDALKVLSEPDYPLIAVFDWVMPGIDGPELCRRIKNNPAIDFVYLLLLSGKNDEKDLVVGLDAGADDYLTKPIKPEELKSRIAVGVRTVRYEQKFMFLNKELKEKNEALEKYARIMETLAEERARKLIHAERLSSLGELSAGMAHEINNYLVPVTGYLEMLSVRIQHTGLSSEKIKLLNDCISGIAGGAERIKNLMERIRTHSRRNNAERALININDVINHSLELCTGKMKRHTVEKNLAEKLPWVIANMQELEQVYVNIFKNAADALEGRSLGKIKVRSFLEGSKVIAIVEDNGPGIPPDKLDQIWDAFFTTKSSEKGTGLGLSVSKGIIDGLGGCISASNHESGGAVFRIELPVAK